MPNDFGGTSPERLSVAGRNPYVGKLGHTLTLNLSTWHPSSRPIGLLIKEAGQD